MTFDVALDSPWYLLVLLVAPWIWRASRRSLAGLGPTRSWLAVILRTMIVVAIALALSELKTRQADQGVAVVYVLDQSQSIPAPKREAMFEYVVKEVAAHRRDERGDQAGVIVFGRQARVESPVVDQDLAWLTQTAPLAETWSEATDIEAAIRLAATVLPDRGQRRVVLMTDGNETMGNSLPLSQQLAAQGIGMDVVAIEHDGLGNVAVEKVAAPTVARDGMNSEIRVLLRYDPSKVTDSAPETISGKVHVTRRLGDDQHLVAEQDVELAPGLNVLRFVDSGDVPSGFYTYEAHFVGRDFHESTLADNQATAYTHREGQGKVLLIENVDSPGEFDSLASRMREQSLDVEIRRSDAPFQSLADLRSFDCVMLANVARVSVSGNSLFSEFQMEALVRNTEMGSGLILLGGPASFGAGGWANTRLEEASPVNFTIDNAKVAPSGALVLVIDKSGSMSGEKMDMCRRAAIEAVRVLSAKDHVGVVAFDGEPHWIVPMQRIGAQRNAIALRISRLAADGGTDMFPGMQQAVHGLQSVDAAVKHMIVLSDGQTPPAEFDRLSRRMRNAGITVSGVAVGSDAAQSLLAGIAQQGGGGVLRRYLTAGHTADLRQGGDACHQAAGLRTEGRLCSQDRRAT